ncbi:MAG: response regulator [Lachnospiraceae bacterium]|nr:response regulator [Lachnospiraceae bacterium]
MVKTKENLIGKVLNGMFIVMLFCVILFLVIGELIMPEENPTGIGKSRLLEAQWERVFPDGSREKIVLPATCDAMRGETVRIETTLTENQQDTWMCMRASQQDMYVYVGGELRMEYCTRDSRLFGRDSVSAFVFFEIKDEDAGKVLSIETISRCEYSGFLNEIYVGEKLDIVYTLLEQCAVVLMVSLCMLVLSTITLLVAGILRIVYKVKMDIAYLGLGLLQLSLAMLSESRIRQLFLPNSSVASYVGFLLTILIPYPFMVYICRLQKKRYEKLYKVLSWFVAADFFASVLLQVFGVADLSDTSIVAYGCIVVMILIMAITIVLDIVRGKLQEYGEVAIGIVAMIIVTAWEVYTNFVPEVAIHGGVLLSFGLLVLLVTAIFKTAREMLAVEKEKQMAIAAGNAKTQFLANMSHEIRTPINTIIGMNEMILREGQDDIVREYAQNVENASNLLLGLINDILDFSKIEAGKLDIVEAEYHLSKMLADIVKGIQIKVDSKRLKLNVNIEESLPAILKGDEIRIRQILNNLLSNAVKYTKEGSVTFAVKGIYSQDEFILHLSVEDTGMGIKPEDMERLFRSFQRLEEQKNRYIEGTGLGLNITKRLTEMMGGNIEVTSEYGKGSCFTVKIPQQVIDASPLGKLDQAYQRDSFSRENVESRLYAPTAEILVVDDNEMNLLVAKSLLKRTGIQLTLAQGGRECLKLSRNHKFDLILMDHMMPEPDGIETLHFLRKDEGNPNRNTKVVVLTANAISGMAEMYRNEGFTDYLSKPIVAQQLEEMICKYLPEEKVEKRLEEKQTEEKTTEETEKKESTIIDRNAGLSYCDGDEEMYREMIRSFCAQGEKYVSELEKYFSERDWKNYRIIVHSLKSTALVIGANNFSEHAKKMELAAKENKETLLLAEGEKFITEYVELLKLLKDI